VARGELAIGENDTPTELQNPPNKIMSYLSISFVLGFPVGFCKYYFVRLLPMHPSSFSRRVIPPGAWAIRL
jgi:hypothetical protein